MLMHNPNLCALIECFVVISASVQQVHPNNFERVSLLLQTVVVTICFFPLLLILLAYVHQSSPFQFESTFDVFSLNILVYV